MRLKMKKKKRGRPASAVPLVAFQLRLPATLNRVLEEAALAGHRPKNSEIVLAIEEHLAGLGRWPPRNGEANSEHLD